MHESLGMGVGGGGGGYDKWYQLIVAAVSLRKNL